MLIGLSIRNVVLIDKLDLVFQKGFSVLTGETGAGKSILLDSLSLALGTRGEASLILQGAEQAQVTAEFDLTAYEAFHPMWDFLNEQGLNAEEGKLLLRRHLYRIKASRAFVNDQAVSVKTLRQLGEVLLEVHNQFDRLFDITLHRETLDRFAKNHNPLVNQQLEHVKQTYEHWRTAENDLKTHQKALQDNLHQEAFRRQIIQDLEPLKLIPNEEENLLAQRQTLSHYGKISQAVKEALKALTHPHDVAAQIIQAQKALSRANQETLPSVGSTLQSLVRAQLEIQLSLEGLKDLIYQDQDSLQALEHLDERLHTLRTLAKRYYVPVNDLYSFYHQHQTLLEQQHEAEYSLKKLAEIVSSRLKDYQQAAQLLTTSRQQAAKTLMQALSQELPDLKLAQARFVIDFQAQGSDQLPTPFGSDKIEFLIATNPGQSPSSFSKVASGGELSRLMLALKVVLTDRGYNSTLVFDEVDTGVGGAVAAAIGQRLKNLSHHLQVLAITHLPQVAGYADHHYKVMKQTTAGLNQTTVILLDLEQRRTELARMLAGETITPEAYAAANQLLYPSSALSL